jgi:hypothetical protein
MNKSYRILKLRSGEEIIAKINGQTKDKMIIERPMIFLHRYFTDTYGKERELTVLKSWMSHTNEIETKIPKDYIATFLVPDSDVITLYNKEKEREDTDQRPPKQIVDLSKPLPPKNDRDDIENNFYDMFKEVMGNLSELEDDDPEEGLSPTQKPKDDSSVNDMKNFITMTMFMPPEALTSLVDAGLIDMEDIQNLIDTLSGDDNFMKDIFDYNGDDENRQKDEDFGNDWLDWSPDLREYFK